MQLLHFIIPIKLLTVLLAMVNDLSRTISSSDLQQQQEKNLLLKMQGMVNNTQKSDNKLHEVFEPSFDWKECRTSTFIQQKLKYMHWNPCKGENKLVELPEQYIHSSAKFYITGEQGVYRVTSYTELEDIDLTK